MSSINRTFFFTQVRRTLFANNLRQTQVDGINAILDGWEAKYSAEDDRWLAYALATTYPETDQHMQPIEEYGKGRGMPYGKPDPTTGHRPEPVDGVGSPPLAPTSPSLWLCPRVWVERSRMSAAAGSKTQLPTIGGSRTVTEFGSSQLRAVLMQRARRSCRSRCPGNLSLPTGTMDILAPA
jgi:hypothetical protein